MVHIMNSKYCYHIVLEKNGIQKEEIGFWDTGNGLYTPWTREPVCITEHKYVREFFSEEEYNKQELLLQLKDHVPTCREKIVWIPYHSIGKTQGILPSMYFDRLEIKTEKQTIRYDHLLIAFCKERISRQKQYQLILHNSYIQE
ncbi:MAG: sigma-E processing peptidase SpoIIGA [Lachnospiraceae bacterium]|nr:sigma-E processing peptidase SpoIIGA [Lachnospiraceae bacterium]